jgi:WD40 repeat protein
LAVSASFDETPKVWDVAKGSELRTLKSHRDVVRGVALTVDGCLAVSASEDKTLKVWDVATGQELRTFQDYYSELKAGSDWCGTLSAEGMAGQAWTWSNITPK